jgi:5,10-methylenetetrahydrofolate reductase
MSFLERLKRPEPFTTVELRPPRRDLEGGLSMDSWMDMRRAVERMVERDTALFFTDNAVGAREEENLHHLVSNLDADVSRERICPFLTAKHSLEYCLWYADRAVSEGHSALAVFGGDTSVGPERCLPHAYLLRQRIRQRHPQLALGGWANPYHDAAIQVGYLTAENFTADFFLTQVVNHHEFENVERFVKELADRGCDIPGVFGVFYYRSASPKTLSTLAQFLPVPAEAITKEFATGASADEICARTIRGLRDVGVDRVYVSNLDPGDAAERLEAIEAAVGR